MRKQEIGLFFVFFLPVIPVCGDGIYKEWKGVPGWFMVMGGASSRDIRQMVKFRMN